MGYPEGAVSTDPLQCRAESVLTIVLATSNLGKLNEMGSLLADLPIELCTPTQVLGEYSAVVEDGDTFEANAILKARACCARTGLVALADDSGLEVDALAGRPGVRSARFAGDVATDAENNAALLRELEGVDEPDRAARFRCALALVTPWDSDPVLTSGACEGTILRAPRGSGGFGYDPLFCVREREGRTLAELGEDEKNQVSHRGRAARAMIVNLERLLERLRCDCAKPR